MFELLHIYIAQNHSKAAIRNVQCAHTIEMLWIPSEYNRYAYELHVDFACTYFEKQHYSNDNKQQYEHAEPRKLENSQMH